MGPGAARVRTSAQPVTDLFPGCQAALSRVPALPGRVTSRGPSLSLGLTFLPVRAVPTGAASSREFQGQHPGPNVGPFCLSLEFLPKMAACITLGLRLPERLGVKSPGATQAPTPPPQPAHPLAPPSWPRPSDNLYGPSSVALRMPRAVAQSGSAGAEKPELGLGRSASVDTPPPRDCGHRTRK